MHIPVLLDEVLKYLAPKKGDCIVDATFGAGGHSTAILERIGAHGVLIGFEKDEQAYHAATQAFSTYKNLILVNTGYETMDAVLAERTIASVNGVLFDLGVSSMQLDDALYGMSFRSDAPLDMRFSRTNAIDAAHIVNTYDEAALERILFTYGEERFARRIVRVIVAQRKKHPITTTTELVSCIEHAVPRHRTTHIHPATRTFQALRIAVNDELRVIETGITKAISCCAPGGRVVAISFHSLEDRIVKHLFREQAQGCICPKDIPVCRCGHHPSVRVLTPSPVLPSEEEIRTNPRSRSAKLRAAEKTSCT